MPTPQLPGFGDAAAFIRRFKDIDHRINLLFEKLNNVLANTGLSVPSPGTTQVDGSLNVVGNLNVSGSSTVSGSNGIQSSNYVAGTSGWKFNGTSLEANTGVIGNGALANPINPISLHADATNFSPTPGSGIAAMSVSVTVPAGYTQALFIGLYVSAGAVNSTGSSDFLYATISSIGGSTLPGWQVPSTSTPAGAYANAFQQGTLLKSGLTGGTVLTVTARISTSSATWAANTSNVANLDVSVLFLR